MAKGCGCGGLALLVFGFILSTLTTLVFLSVSLRIVPANLLQTEEAVGLSSLPQKLEQQNRTILTCGYKGMLETFANTSLLFEPSSCAANTRASHSVGPEDIDWSDPIFKRHGWDIDPVVIESHKLLFFTVPKNSCTEWKLLFRRILGYSDWREAPPHNPATNGITYLGSYPKEKQLEFIASSDWTRAIFVRDPMERLLSAYKDKALRDPDYVRRHCCRRPILRRIQSRPYKDICKFLSNITQTNSSIDSRDFPFETFITGGFLTQCTDPHWQPQSERMRTKNWKIINFVGRFENLAHDARCLLVKIGAWDEYGATGWGKHQNASFLEKNIANHATSAKGSLDEYYTPELRAIAQQFLQHDYVVEELEFTRPCLME